MALLRDKLDGHERFSLIREMTQEGRGGRILCEVDEVAIHVRGVEVAEEQRGRGLAKLRWGCWRRSCAGRCGVRHRPQTKPVVARALTSLGFRPVDAAWPIFAAPSPGSRTLVCPADPTDGWSTSRADPRAPDVVAALPPGAKPTFGRVHPTPRPRGDGACRPYAALAFAGTESLRRGRWRGRLLCCVVRVLPHGG